MRHNANLMENFEYICGEIFTLDINGDIAGDFIITKCYPVKNTYTLQNRDLDSNIESVVVDRFVFENRARKAHKERTSVIKLDIYDYDNIQSIKYREIIDFLKK